MYLREFHTTDALAMPLNSVNIHEHVTVRVKHAFALEKYSILASRSDESGDGKLVDSSAKHNL